MEKTFTASIFILAFCTFVFGQNTEKSVCPKISINVGNLLVRAGEETSFTAKINFPDADKLEYQWSVLNGIIVNGQGTNKVTVQADSYDGITAVVEIKGLPEGCPNSEADSTAPICGTSSILIDKIDVLFDNITEERLNAWAAEIESHPSAKLYLIIYNNQKFPPKKFKEKIAYIKKYLFDRNIKENDRLVIINEDKSEDKINNHVKIFVVPDGAIVPTP